MSRWVLFALSYDCLKKKTYACLAEKSYDLIIVASSVDCYYHLVASIQSWTVTSHSLRAIWKLRVHGLDMFNIQKILTLFEPHDFSFYSDLIWNYFIIFMKTSS